jgi:serine/threonine-protein phosphatase PGAM5
LVRHGQYVAAAGEGVEALTPLGRRQAVHLGKRLKAVDFGAVWHSDAPRAVETVEILAGFLPDVPLHGSRLLREGIPSVAAHFSAEFRPPRAQMQETRRRMDRAFERFFRRSNQDKKELIVAHGNLIRYLVRRALEDAAHRWWQLDILQCGLSILRVTKRGTALVSFNDVGHLPPNLQTFL